MTGGVAPLVAIIGGGQLALMLVEAAQKLGVRTRVLDPKPDCTAGRITEHVVGGFDDAAALEQLARGADVVTYEFENVPVASARMCEGFAPVQPVPAALEVAQDRLSERQLLARLGVPTPAYEVIDSLEDLQAAAKRGGDTALLKARRLGYDGKGQFLLSSPEQAAQAWDAIGKAPAILDSFVDFKRELSVLAVRSGDGEVRVWPLIENVHRGGVLRLSRAPAAGVTPELQQQAERHARAVLEDLGYIGVLALEFFQVGTGASAKLIANELAPRVHNSGHWTIEGAATSQFENHLRAILGMPLGSTKAVGFSAMVNFIGRPPRPGAERAVEGATLHDYHKAAKPGRKVAHVTLVAPTEAQLHDRLERFTRVVG